MKGQNHRIMSKRQALSILLLVLVAVLLFVFISKARSSNNGFDLSGSLIPKQQILHGGPHRDGIPALTKPGFIKAAQAHFLRPESRVMGVSLYGEAKAYPIAILNYHEIVNDQLGGQAITVTFCPLCGTGMVYDARVGGRVLEFGVSGLLYNSDLLLYDRLTESLWSQVMAKAVTGPMKGRTLKRISASHTSWQDWLTRFPDTFVLSLNTGYWRNYQQTPYLGYSESDELYFPVAHYDSRYPKKERVVAIEVNEQHKSYPFSELARYQLSRQSNRIRDKVAGKELIVKFDLNANSARVFDNQGKEVPSFQAFWFAWVAFYPQSQVYVFEP